MAVKQASVSLFTLVCNSAHIWKGCEGRTSVYLVIQDKQNDGSNMKLVESHCETQIKSTCVNLALKFQQ